MAMVRKIAGDRVPKTIMLYIINDLKDYIEIKLQAILFDPKSLVSSTMNKH